MKIYLLIGWALFFGTVTAEPEPEFRQSPLTRSETLPQRRWHPDAEEAKIWKAPFAEPLQALLALGLPDPKDLPYHKIEIPTGNCHTGDSGIAQTEGWLLPRAEGDGEGHAIAWNGLIYPVIADKGPADLAARAKEIEAGKGLEREWYAQGEEIETAPSGTGSIRSLYFARLGFEAAALKLLPADRGQPAPYLPTLAADWRWFLYDRAVCAHMRGDPKLAFASLEELKRVYPALEKWIAAARAEPTKTEGWSLELEAFRLECKRRIEGGIAGRLDEKAFVAGKPDVAALIGALDRIGIPQSGQPGDVPLWEAPVVTELAARGADAVEPLLACLESDPRLTQSVHYWRDFNRSRTILGVHEAALYALQALLHADFFELASTGDSLSGRGEDYRKKLAALIRANWEKYGKTGGPQRSYRILLDDAAGADAWIDAANSLLHKVEYDEDTGQAIPPKGPLPGEGLRELHDPSISDLLEKRIREVGKAAADGDEDPHRARLALLAALLDWDLPRGRESIRKQTASWLKNRTWSKEPAAILARFVQEVSDRVPEILPLFEDMAWTLAPEKYDNSNSQPVFVTQMILQHGNALKRKGKELWTDGESPWCLRKLGRDDLENVMTYWRDQKLLATPPFRELAIAALEDGSKCSEAGVDAEDPTQWYQHVAGGKVTRRIPDGKETKFALKPGKPLPIRRKDVAGRALKLSGEVGEEPKEPVLEYYWSLQERDEWLKKYSQELQKPAPPPPGK